MKELLKRIEHLRQILNNLSDGELTSYEIIKTSQALDDALNEYSNRLKNWFEDKASN
ncbi:MAG: aspartyl-phosphate phosphatase Spo0E family protein [Gorillibacterium sp.]|nr:aspartyl-phosphate phosphatase Spo0E family protein [Gorillibacterium sp.]